MAESHASSPPKYIERITEFYHSEEFDGSVVFQVRNALYRVPRLFFLRDSRVFRSALTLSSPSEGKLSVPEGTDDRNPIHLDGITPQEFESLLSILCPVDHYKALVKTVPEWSSVLHLATMWEFASVRTLAIKYLEVTASPVDKIVLARSCNVPEWLLPSYIALCDSTDPIPIEDGRRLGMGDVIRIYRLRTTDVKIHRGSSLFSQKVIAEFGLPKI